MRFARSGIAIAAGFLVFSAICLTVFLTSRKRPGETPIGRLMEHLGALVARFRPKHAESQPA